MSIFGEEELREVIEGVWITALDLEIEENYLEEFVSGNSITAQISISGEWSGVISLRASVELLSLAASIMFTCPSDEVTDMDRSDTLTELTNMVGGTIKCLLPEGCDLSLPEIKQDVGADAQGADWVSFCCESMPLAVAVEKLSDGKQKAA